MRLSFMCYSKNYYKKVELFKSSHPSVALSPKVPLQSDPQTLTRALALKSDLLTDFKNIGAHSCIQIRQ